MKDQIFNKVNEDCCKSARENASCVLNRVADELQEKSMKMRRLAKSSECVNTEIEEALWTYAQGEMARLYR